MTSFQHRRCHHCLVTYSYQASGPGPYDPHNDGRYCPECTAVVHAALAVVPRKFEQTWVTSVEVTLDTLLEWERQNDEESRARGGIQVRRVAQPLFRLPDFTTQRTGIVRGRGIMAGRTFEYRYWEGEEAGAEIREEVERNLSTGEIRPWNSPYSPPPAPLPRSALPSIYELIAGDDDK